jgi:hypothetical protein
MYNQEHQELVFVSGNGPSASALMRFVSGVAAAPGAAPGRTNYAQLIGAAGPVIPGGELRVVDHGRVLRQHGRDPGGACHAEGRARVRALLD